MRTRHQQIALVAGAFEIALGLALGAGLLKFGLGLAVAGLNRAAAQREQNAAAAFAAENLLAAKGAAKNERVDYQRLTVIENAPPLFSDDPQLVQPVAEKTRNGRDPQSLPRPR